MAVSSENGWMTSIETFILLLRYLYGQHQTRSSEGFSVVIAQYASGGKTLQSECVNVSGTPGRLVAVWCKRVFAGRRAGL